MEMGCTDKPRQVANQLHHMNYTDSTSISGLARWCHLDSTPPSNCGSSSAFGQPTSSLHDFVKGPLTEHSNAILSSRQDSHPTLNSTHLHTIRSKYTFIFVTAPRSIQISQNHNPFPDLETPSGSQHTVTGTPSAALTSSPGSQEKTLHSSHQSQLPCLFETIIVLSPRAVLFVPAFSLGPHGMGVLD
ncbi:hypothetical protein BC835DRAFT_1010513 [Cytidiella melzeri]|nr:hypothetical protein BC835DRAFT_1010513 [Cytidiella melzeri]